jgi:hypothetical protein
MEDLVRALQINAAILQEISRKNRMRENTVMRVLMPEPEDCVIEITIGAALDLANEALEPIMNPPA